MIEGLFPGRNAYVRKTLTISPIVKYGNDGTTTGQMGHYMLVFIDIFII